MQRTCLKISREGWDGVNNCAKDDYQFYNKVLAKEIEGNTLSEGIGSQY